MTIDKEKKNKFCVPKSRFLFFLGVGIVGFIFFVSFIWAEQVSPSANYPKTLWKEGGVIVNDSPGNTIQRNVKIIKSGISDYILVFEDLRDGNADLYMQKISEDGSRLWGITAFPLIKFKNDQIFPQIISDNAGGVFIVWQDDRNGDFDIYLQRVSANGTLLYAKTGVPVCAARGGQIFPKIISDGEDGVIITWFDYRSGEEDIYAQKVDSKGRSLWMLNGVLVCNEKATQWYPEIAGDGKGGAFLAWADRRSGDFDVYAQHVDMEGKNTWPASGIAVCKIGGNQENPKIVKDKNGGVFITWLDKRSGDAGVFIQNLDINAKSLFEKNGLKVADTFSNPTPPEIVSDKDGGCTLVWSDPHAGDSDVYMQRVSSHGVLLWGGDARPVVSKRGIQSNPKIYGTSPFYVVWGDKAVAASRQDFEQTNPEVAADGKGGVYVVWEDERKLSGTKIYLQHFDQEGEALFPGGIELTPKRISSRQTKPKIVSFEGGGAVVVFINEDTTSGKFDIGTQRIDSKGTLLWGGGGKLVSFSIGRQDSPLIMPVSLFTVWIDYSKGEKNSDIRAQKLDLSGNIVFQDDGIPVCEAPDLQKDLTMAADNLGVIVGWTDKGSGNFDVYAQKIDIKGKNLWIKDGVPVCQVGRTQQRPKVISLRGGESFFVWEDFRFGNWDIFGQEIERDGRIKEDKDNKDGIDICSAPGTQYSPSIINLDDDKIIAWEDYRSGANYNIYLQALNKSNVTIFPKNGVKIKETAGGARAPKLLPTGKREFLLVWEDLSDGGRSIAAQKFRF